jgi:hypothetical protein
MPEQIYESAPLVQAAAEGAIGRKFRARLIESEVNGSSGFYSREVLESAAHRAVFHTGLPMFIDHPGVQEREDRPERSIRDLAGVLASDAVLEADGLYADVMLYSHVAPVINEMKDHIGLSIRAAGQIAETPNGRVVTEITEALSVDYVTAAGAGGKLISLLESAGSPFTPATTDVPVSSAGQTSTTESTSKELIKMAEIEEARLRELEEAAGRVASLEAERGQLIERAEAAEQRAAAAEQAIKDRDLREAAVKQIAEATKELPEAMADRVAETVLGKPLPVADDKIDEAKLAESITAAIDAEKAYAEALNPKMLSGFGASTPANESVQEAQVENPWGRKIKEA